MLRLLAVMVALFLAAAPSVGWAGEMVPPAKGQPAAPRQEAPAGAREVEGKIKSLNRSGNTVTLEDGTVLMIPSSVKVQRGALKEGALVKATYEEKGGEKVVTAIEVQPEKKS